MKEIKEGGEDVLFLSWVDEFELNVGVTRGN